MTLDFANQAVARSLILATMIDPGLVPAASQPAQRQRSEHNGTPLVSRTSPQKAGGLRRAPTAGAPKLPGLEFVLQVRSSVAVAAGRCVQLG
jgi:hypothetical protein